MAKKMSIGGKRMLSLIFHLVVLVAMVTAYDAMRAALKGDGAKKENTEKTTKDGKAGSQKKATTKKGDANLATKPISKSSGKEKAGTSMEDLMAAKKQKDLEKKAAADAKKKEK